MIHQGDCREVMAAMAPESIDAIVTDPPYALLDHSRNDSPRTKGTGPYGRHGATGFMGQKWDVGDVAFNPATWEAALRVLKPGGHLLAFGGTRTFHRLTCAIEDAGFEIRDCLSWLYGSGFPKSLDVSKAIDKAAGVAREVVGSEPDRWTNKGSVLNFATDRPQAEIPITGGAATIEAKTWEGWGTALKPAWEPIIMARKPLSERHVAANVLRHGTGAINVADCRLPVEDLDYARNASGDRGHDQNQERQQDYHLTAGHAHAGGRWPANVVLDEEAADALDAQTGDLQSGFMSAGTERQGIGYHGGLGNLVSNDTRGDRGGGSRFYYTAKAGARERSLGLSGRNTHPTVKPISLMVWLVRMVTPSGGVVLDPFLGSGTTAIAAASCGFAWIGIEREAEYVAIAEQRLALFAGDDARAGLP
jgi:site-specific DNA-methyltransferase (adenine-specific)